MIMFSSIVVENVEASQNGDILQVFVVSTIYSKSLITAACLKPVDDRHTT